MAIAAGRDAVNGRLGALAAPIGEQLIELLRKLGGIDGARCAEDRARGVLYFAPPLRQFVVRDRGQARFGSESRAIEGRAVVTLPRLEHGPLLRIVRECRDRLERQIARGFDGILIEPGMENHVGQQRKSRVQTLSQQNRTEAKEVGSVIHTS